MNVNGTAGNAYPLDRNKALHNSIADKVTELNSLLAVPNNSVENYWSQEGQKGYFDNAVAVTYNVDGSGNTAYYNATTTLNNFLVPNLMCF